MNYNGWWCYKDMSFCQSDMKSRIPEDKTLSNLFREI